RSIGLLKIASRYMDLKDKPHALEYIEESLKLLQKGDASTTRVRIMLSSVPTALGIDKSKAFEVTSLAVRMANHLPTPGVEDKIGTPSRMKYIDEILMPNAFNLASAFELLARSDV